MQCEGSTFATAELKSFTSLFLSTFDVEVILPVGKADFDKLYEPIKLAGVQGNGFRPRRIPGRGTSRLCPVSVFGCAANHIHRHSVASCV